MAEQHNESASGATAPPPEENISRNVVVVDLEAVDQVTHQVEEIAANQCPHCKAFFKNERGVKSHIAKSHVKKTMQSREAGAPTSKLRWTQDELNHMAHIEAEVLIRGDHRELLSIDATIAKTLTTRTIASIRGQRKKEEYKSLVTALKEKLVEFPANSSNANIEPQIIRKIIRYTNEEISLMTRLEAEVLLEGNNPDINEFLHSKLPHRTAESIKSRRKDRAYKLGVEVLRKEIRDFRQQADRDVSSIETLEVNMVPDT
jgi:uncharacterized C2H2 Zn-finger protein